MNVTPHEALQRMRQLTEVGVPFAFTFNSLNTTKGTSQGLKVVKRAVLRKGLRDDQSSLSHKLIAYTDLDQKEQPRFFHIALLQSFNEHIIKP